MGMTYVVLEAVNGDTLLGALTKAHHNATSRVTAEKPL